MSQCTLLRLLTQVNNLKVQTANDLVIEYKCNGRGNYQRMDPGMSKQIKDYLNKSLVAFWVKNAGTFFLLDFETMQQFNVSTGFRRSIRYRGSCIPTQSAAKKRKRKCSPVSHLAFRFSLPEQQGPLELSDCMHMIYFIDCYHAQCVRVLNSSRQINLLRFGHIILPSQ